MMVPIAIAACLAASLALAAGSATRLRAGDERVVTAPPVVSVAPVARPAIPLVSIDDVPRASDVPVSHAPAPPRSGSKSGTLAAHAPSPITPTSDCQPPYIVDPETGRKQWRLECL